MTIAFIGGSFDPIHIGHLKMAEEVLKLEQINRVVFIPAFHNVHGKQMAEFDHRCHCCYLTSNCNKNIKIFREMNSYKNGPTINLLKCITINYDEDFYYVMGLDVANNIETYKNWNILIKDFKIIVVGRKGYIPQKNWFLKSPHIYIADADIPDIHSSNIKFMIKLNKAEMIREHLLPEVYEFLKNHPEMYGSINTL